MTKRKSPYSGILSQPIEPQRTESLLAPETEEKWQERYRQAIDERMTALLEHYGIDRGSPTTWSTLALVLALEHVPGCKIQQDNHRSGGRPTKWKGTKSWELYADVQVLVEEGHSEMNACRILTRRERYKGHTKENLYARLKETDSKGSLPGFIDKMRSEGAPVDEWLIEHFSMSPKTSD